MHYSLFSKTLLLLACFLPAHAFGKLVKITGACSDSTINRIALTLPSRFWGEAVPQTLSASKRLPDGSFALEIDIDRPLMASLMVVGETWKVYITPGDSVHFNIEHMDGKLQIRFEGTNVPHYNYYSLLTTASDPRKNRPRYSKDKNVISYRASVDKWYQQKIAFLELYKKNNPVSDDFNAVASAQVLYEYIYFLYAPLSNHDIGHAGIPPGYFAGADTLDLDHQELLSLFEYRIALRAKYITGFTDERLKSFDSIYNNIRLTFKGGVRDFLIADMLGFFSQKVSQEYDHHVENAFEAALSEVRDSVCLTYIKKRRLEYAALGRTFPKEVLNSTYIENMDGTRLSLQDLLNQYAGRALYIDFWASWCTACRADIANSAEARKFLDDKNVVYLYFSLDTNKQKKKWQKAAEHDRITTNQFIVKNDFSSPLARFLQIASIPRYLILSPSHTIKHLNAPRPTIYQLKQLKETIAESVIQTKTFN